MNLIKFENISKTINTLEGKKEILKNVSFQIEENSLTIISGANGSGKTFLMSILAGLEKQDSGSFSSFGKVGYVFQEAETQILGETIEEDILFGLKNIYKDKEKIKLISEEILKKVNLYEKRNSIARFLSGGEKRKLAISCMLAMNFPIIILDEPYANLDYFGIQQINKLILELKNENKTIIILSHELEKCMALADKFIVLYKGEKVFDGKAEDAVKTNLEQWGIRNPINTYNSFKDLLWL